MKLKIKYFAVLRERAGISEEWIETEAANIEDVYGELDQRHNFGLDSEHLRVAINASYQDFSAKLSDGDELVFIPPVAGG